MLVLLLKAKLKSRADEDERPLSDQGIFLQTGSKDHLGPWQTSMMELFSEKANLSNLTYQS